nr:MAG TPA: hypothetical protein [Caudoviricetes sp.]
MIVFYSKRAKTTAIALYLRLKSLYVGKIML